MKKKWLEREVKEKQIGNVTILPPRPRDEQKIFLNACDVGLVPLVEKMRGVAMPSRTYNLLAAGKPILALTETDSEVARVIDEERVGWHVPPRDAENLKTVILKVFDEDAERIPRIQSAARRAALEKYSVELAVKKYQAAIANLNNNDFASDNEVEKLK